MAARARPRVVPISSAPPPGPGAVVVVEGEGGAPLDALPLDPAGVRAPAIAAAVQVPGGGSIVLELAPRAPRAPAPALEGE